MDWFHFAEPILNIGEYFLFHLKVTIQKNVIQIQILPSLFFQPKLQCHEESARYCWVEPCRVDLVSVEHSSVEPLPVQAP